MGRKGVSKRKEKKAKIPMNETPAGAISAVVRASDNQSVKSLDIGKSSPFGSGEKKTESDKKKKSKKK